MRSHFGDKSGALKAVAHGRPHLQPNDYEVPDFEKRNCRRSISGTNGDHWINRDADQTLQQGLDEDADDNTFHFLYNRQFRRTGSFLGYLGPKPEIYTPNAPFTQFPYTVNGHVIDLIFQMNEGGMSNRIDWLKRLRDTLQNELWLERNHPMAAALSGIRTNLAIRTTVSVCFIS